MIEEAGYQHAHLKEAKALHGQMPNDEYYFYVLKSLNFQPKLMGDP